MADKQPMSREAYRQQQANDKRHHNKADQQAHATIKTDTITEAKIKRLKRKLNWAILIVIILIVIVYIILFKA